LLCRLRYPGELTIFHLKVLAFRSYNFDLIFLRLLGKLRRCFVESPTTFELTCALCHQPVSLTTDTCTDENGNAVHEKCYSQQIGMSNMSNSFLLPPAS
jgi:hypothetical protein